MTPFPEMCWPINGPTKANKTFLFFIFYFSPSPYESLDGGAHDAGEEEEGRDQDVKEGQGGKGHSWGQIGVLGDVDVDHKRLQGHRKDTESWVSLK